MARQKFDFETIEDIKKKWADVFDVKDKTSDEGVRVIQIIEKQSQAPIYKMQWTPGSYERDTGELKEIICELDNDAADAIDERVCSAVSAWLNNGLHLVDD